MRFLPLPVLVLVLLISGCGKHESAKQAGVAAPRHSQELRVSEDSAASAKEPAREARLESSATIEAPRSEPATAKPDAPPIRVFSDKPRESRVPEQPPEPGDREFRLKMKPGTLTAGSLNDHQNLDDYRDYLSQVQQTGRSLPGFSLGERVWIEVRDGQGNGIPGAQVTVSAVGDSEGEEGVLLDTFTRADGNTVFCSGLEARALGETFELTVRPPGGKAIIKQMSISQSPWLVEVPDATGQLPEQLDLALVIDTTQSMADELNYLRVELASIVSAVRLLFPNVDQRYALILYRDHGDEYVVRNAIDFTGSLPDFLSQLSAQSTQGGGDEPEAMHLALENANKLSWRPGNTARVMFLVADAPPHDQYITRTRDAVEDLRRKGVAVYPIAGSGPMEVCEYVMRATAFLTRGQYLFLTDHSGVGNPHARPTAPKYEVEPLNQLMIRMIASELAGKPVLAKDIIAIEEGDGSQPPVIPGEQNQSSVHSSGQNMVSHPPVEYGFCGTPDPRQQFWDTTWFRILAAAVLIAGILLLDNRLRM